MVVGILAGSFSLSMTHMYIAYGYAIRSGANYQDNSQKLNL